MAATATRWQNGRMLVTTVAMLTAGGLAPCLSAAVGGLIERYTEVAPEVRIIGYLNGYAGLLTGVGDSDQRGAGSAPAGCTLRRQPARQQPGQAHQRRRLRQARTGQARARTRCRSRPSNSPRDGVDVLHTIGGDDTNTTAADLAAYLGSNGYQLTVVGLPKTVDNDVMPIRQSLGAWTRGRTGRDFRPQHRRRALVQPAHAHRARGDGRNCGWLTAATALAHHQWVRRLEFAEGWRTTPAMGRPRRLCARTGDRHRRRGRPAAESMDRVSTVTLFVSEGPASARPSSRWRRPARMCRVTRSTTSRSTASTRAWFAKQFAAELGAEKTIVQKSGYFARSAAANEDDLALIRSCTT